MTKDVSPAFVKALFYQLVKAVGGTEAAGAYLEVSHQRVSQLQSPNSADMPGLMQVIKLEAVAGVPIVTGALAKLVEGASGKKSMEDEVFDVTQAAVDLHASVRSGADPKTIEGKVIRLRREAEDVTAAFTQGRA